MKITAINLPKEENDKGLDTIQMRGLRRIVLVAGKNGSGKSRLLDTIATEIRGNHEERVRKLSQLISTKSAELRRKQPELHIYQHDLDKREELRHQIRAGRDNIEQSRLPEEEIQKQLEIYDERSSLKEQELEEFFTDRNKQAQKKYEQELNVYREEIAPPLQDEIEKLQEQKKEAINFFVCDPPFRFDEQQPQRVSRNRPAEQHKKLLVQEFSLSTDIQDILAYIQDLCNNVIVNNNPFHPIENSSFAQGAQKEFESLQSFLKENLGIELKAYHTSSNDKGAKLDGRPLSAIGLSDGQKILLRLAFQFFKGRIEFSDGIILLDEPENHLHPQALINELMAKIEDLKIGQIWVATHSVNLMAHYFDNKDASLYYMENGKAHYASDKPEKILNSLMGGEHDKLHAFTALPAQFAAICFAGECLLDSEVVMTESSDPQIAQIKLAIGGSVLNYGAGQGRLLSNLYESEKTDKGTFAQRISYYAWDVDSKYQETCEGIIKEIYGDGERRYFGPSTKPDNLAVDYMVMCNVLHEIPPGEWCNVFSKDGILAQSLNEEGHLLIVEDLCLKTGERAHESGFHILDKAALSKLFDTDAITETDHHQDKYKGRLKIFHIPKSFISNVTDITVKCAIESIRETALEKITASLSERTRFADGKEHAFWTQQYANAAVFLHMQNQMQPPLNEPT